MPYINIIFAEIANMNFITISELQVLLLIASFKFCTVKQRHFACYVLFPYFLHFPIQSPSFHCHHAPAMQLLIIYQIYLTTANVQYTLANPNARQKKNFSFLAFFAGKVDFLYYPCKYIVPGSQYYYPVNFILTCRLQLIKNISSCNKVCLSQRYRDSMNDWENMNGK